MAGKRIVNRSRPGDSLRIPDGPRVEHTPSPPPETEWGGYTPPYGYAGPEELPRVLHRDATVFKDSHPDLDLGMLLSPGMQFEPSIPRGELTAEQLRDVMRGLVASAHHLVTYPPRPNMFLETGSDQDYRSLAGDYAKGLELVEHGNIVNGRTVFGDPSISIGLHTETELALTPPHRLQITGFDDGFTVGAVHSAHQRLTTPFIDSRHNLPAMLADERFIEYMGGIALSIAQRPTLPTHHFEGGHSSTIDLGHVSGALEQLAEQEGLKVDPLALRADREDAYPWIGGAVWSGDIGTGVIVEAYHHAKVGKKEASRTDRSSLAETNKNGVFKAVMPRALSKEPVTLGARIQPVIRTRHNFTFFDTRTNPLRMDGERVEVLTSAADALRDAILKNRELS